MEETSSPGLPVYPVETGREMVLWGTLHSSLPMLLSLGCLLEQQTSGKHLCQALISFCHVVPELITTRMDIFVSPSTSSSFSNPVRGLSRPSLPVLLHHTFSELVFQQTRDAPKGEKVLHGGRGSKAGFPLPPPLFCSHYGPGALLPQHRKQSTGLKGPSSLCNSCNCL